MIGFGQDNNVIYRKDLNQGSQYPLESKFQRKKKDVQINEVEDISKEVQIFSTNRESHLKIQRDSLLKKSPHLLMPYPVIFIHGLIGDWESWTPFGDFLESWGWYRGDWIDFCLNSHGSSNQDICDLDFEVKNHTPLPVEEGDFYIINFDCDPNNCNTAAGANNSVLSNQASIVAQGKAIGMAIDYVLDANTANQADKVILMGHSMGGLAAREYIEDSSHWKHDPNSHRVAKLITTGTPHGGSNATLGSFSTVFADLIALFTGGNPLDEISESIRDLRSTYSNGNNGAYLFGGPPMMENDNYINHSGTPYNNVDINCDGDELDPVVGLNTAPTIPGNIEKTCIIGTSDLTTTTPNATVEVSDGVVDTAKANINNYYNSSAEVFKINFHHLELTDATYTNFKALDEPEYFKFAYKIAAEGDTMTGYSTFQASNHPDFANSMHVDIDSYYFLVNQYSLIDIQVHNLNTNGSIELFADDINYTSQAFANANSAGTAMIQKYLNPGKYYIDITADAYSNVGPSGTYPWENPYHFIVSTLWTSSVSESLTQKRTLVKIIDVLGRETKATKNQSYFYIYDDGTVEKRIIIE
tara:strand:+ start:308 stop:2062 length:1755 start_codon:yes stop_codon:yes gene_type:complete